MYVFLCFPHTSYVPIFVPLYFVWPQPSLIFYASRTRTSHVRLCSGSASLRFLIFMGFITNTSVTGIPFFSNLRTSCILSCNLTSGLPWVINEMDVTGDGHQRSHSATWWYQSLGHLVLFLQRLPRLMATSFECCLTTIPKGSFKEFG